MTERAVLEKMGFRAGQKARIWNLPETLKSVFESALEGGSATRENGEPPPSGWDWHLAFAVDARAIEDAAARFVPDYRRGQSLWIAYLKRSSGMRTDISRDVGWDPIAALGLLGVTQISIDDTWSALRFRYRDEIKVLSRKT